MSGVLFKVIFVGLFVCSVGSDVSIQGSSATAIIGEPFTITCTGQYDILLIRLGNTLTIFPVYNFLGANADNTCKPSGSFNTNYTYTCTNDSTTLTYSTTIPGKYVTEDLDNSNWTCTNVFDATAKVGFYTLNVTSESQSIFSTSDVSPTTYPPSTDIWISTLKWTSADVTMINISDFATVGDWLASHLTTSLQSTSNINNRTSLITHIMGDTTTKSLTGFGNSGFSEHQNTISQMSIYTQGFMSSFSQDINDLSTSSMFLISYGSSRFAHSSTSSMNNVEHTIVESLSSTNAPDLTFISRLYSQVQDSYSHISYSETSYLNASLTISIDSAIPNSLLNPYLTFKTLSTEKEKQEFSHSTLQSIHTVQGTTYPTFSTKSSSNSHSILYYSSLPHISDYVDIWSSETFGKVDSTAQSFSQIELETSINRPSLISFVGNSLFFDTKSFYSSNAVEGNFRTSLSVFETNYDSSNEFIFNSVRTVSHTNKVNSIEGSDTIQSSNEARIPTKTFVSVIDLSDSFSTPREISTMLKADTPRLTSEHFDVSSTKIFTQTFMINTLNVSNSTILTTHAVFHSTSNLPSSSPHSISSISQDMRVSPSTIMASSSIVQISYINKGTTVPSLNQESKIIAISVSAAACVAVVAISITILFALKLLRCNLKKTSKTKNKTEKYDDSSSYYGSSDSDGKHNFF